MRAGAEIDAFCGKCHLVTNHRVVALEGTKIKKVVCLTCQAQHNYRKSAPKTPETKGDESQAALSSTGSVKTAKTKAAPPKVTKIKPAKSSAEKPSQEPRHDGQQLEGQLDGQEGDRQVGDDELNDFLNNDQFMEVLEGLAAEERLGAPATPEKAKAKPRAAAKPSTRTRAGTTRPTKASKVQVQDTEATRKLWQDLKASHGNARLIPYLISGVYEAGQALSHDHFGVGFVQKVVHPNKIEVLFENSEKLLIMMEKEPLKV
jgi:hypothetical protein